MVRKPVSDGLPDLLSCPCADMGADTLERRQIGYVFLRRLVQQPGH